MMTIHPIPAFSDNYIWLIRADGSHEVAVVDPGEAAPVITVLEAEGLVLTTILITHHHGDHTGGISELKRRYPCTVYGPAGVPGVDQPQREGDVVGLAGLSFEVMETPGHTRDHLCYHGHGALFCGDTLFSAGCGRLFEGSPEQMHRSLQKIAALDDATRVYCAHEYTLDNLTFAAVAEPQNPAIAERRAEAEAQRQAGEPTLPTTLGEEKRFNPFFHYDDPVLQAAAARFAGRPVSLGADLFGVVRHWKDTLD